MYIWNRVYEQILRNIEMNTATTTTTTTTTITFYFFQTGFEGRQTCYSLLRLWIDITHSLMRAYGFEFLKYALQLNLASQIESPPPLWIDQDGEHDQ